MKRKRILIIIIEFVLLIAVLGGVYQYTQSQIVPTKVFVFNENMNTGEIITKSKLTTMEIPTSAINKNFLRSSEAVLGNVVTTDVSKGQFVLTDLVTEKEHLDPIKLMDLSKMRKVSFAVDMERALAGNIQKGDIVDLVYLSTVDNPETGQEHTYSKIFMSDVVVWSVNTEDGYKYASKSSDSDSYEATSVAGTEVTDMDNANEGDLGSITVIVTGPQAEEIIARSSSGNIQVIGRFEGAEAADTTGYNIHSYSDVFAGNIDPENGEVDESVSETSEESPIE